MSSEADEISVILAGGVSRRIRRLSSAVGGIIHRWSAVVKAPIRHWLLSEDRYSFSGR